MDLVLPPWCEPAIVDTRRGYSLMLAGDDWAPVYTAAITAARVSIDLAQYSVSSRWDGVANDASNCWRALRAAPRRGVRCRALLACARSDSTTARFNFYSAPILRAEGWDVRRSPQARLLHAKITIVDDRLVILGSHNLAASSATRNLDISILLDGPRSAQPFVRYFVELWTKHGNQHPTERTAEPRAGLAPADPIH